MWTWRQKRHGGESFLQSRLNTRVPEQPNSDALAISKNEDSNFASLGRHGCLPILLFCRLSGPYLIHSINYSLFYFRECALFSFKAQEAAVVQSQPAQEEDDSSSLQDDQLDRENDAADEKCPKSLSSVASFSRSNYIHIMHIHIIL